MRFWYALLAAAAPLGALGSAHERDLPLSLPSSLSSSTAAPNTLVPSTDGTCGSGVTCANSTAGGCCSAHGYCGDSDAYCGAGCQPAFGACDAAAPPDPPVQSPQATSVVWLTETLTFSRTAVATSVVTSTSVTVSTLISVSTSITVSTSVITHVSTVVRTRITLVTSTVLATSASLTPSATPVRSPPNPTVTTTLLVGSNGQPIGTVPPTSTTSPTLWFPQPQTNPRAIPRTPAAAVAWPSPSPILSGAAQDCKRYYRVRDSDTCATIAVRVDISVTNLLAWNTQLTEGAVDMYLCGVHGVLPIVVDCKTPCNHLPAGYYLCVGV